MDFNIPNLGRADFSKAVSKNASKINFQGKADIVSFSDATKERFKIIDELTKAGFSNEDANNMVKDYYKSEDYELLVNGEYDKAENTTYTSHFVDKEGNLTPTEAIVYLAYDMEEYYKQNGDWGFGEKELTTIDAKHYNLGKNDFSPLELAKYMYEDLDIVLSGMILKGRLDFETAQKVKEYYDVSKDCFDEKENLKEAEYTAYLFSQNLDKLDYYTSGEKDENGKLLNGLTRPLTKEEAGILVKSDYLRHDTKSLNNYIEMKKRYNVTLYTMDLSDLWDKDPDELSAKPQNITRANVKRTVADLPELIECIGKTYPSLSSEVLDDLKQLDNDKFFKKYPYTAIKFDAMMCAYDDRELRQKNIQVLNSISDELLNKMTTNNNGKKGHFASLVKLLRAENLAQRVNELEEYRQNNPVFFDRMTKDTVMDYLTESDFYTKQADAVKLFLDGLAGVNIYDEENTPAEVVDFPVKHE